MRSPNTIEINAIKAALTEEDYMPDFDYVGIIEHYSPDGPSWSGKAAIWPGGEICFVNIAKFDAFGVTITEIKSAEL